MNRSIRRTLEENILTKASELIIIYWASSKFTIQPSVEYFAHIWTGVTLSGCPDIVIGVKRVTNLLGPVCIAINYTTSLIQL